ncbi:MAG: CTP synthase [Christensenellaceae bacterium]
MRKHIFITGGVVSGLGKGITAASLCRLLKLRGLKVAAQKLDPYMNIDPGTMSPYQHGEVFVTEDGAETDLDLGHYERFIDENLNKFSNLTSGKVYWNVLNKEREGAYLGKTVQVIPHITQEIKSFIYAGAEAADADILITEIGGTTGDIESQPFLEAIRQISFEVGRENCLFIHVTLVPYLKCSGEHKSKPTQHSVKELQSFGISPNIIIMRADEPISQGIRDKIALFCNVPADCVIENITLPNLYEAVIMLHENGLDDVVCRELHLSTPSPDLGEWEAMLERIRRRDKDITIAIAGKYVQLPDAYLSINEALAHAGYNYGAKVHLKFVDTESVTDDNAAEVFSDCDGILVPGGFGERGIEGMISACRYARENDIPYFGICLGMQIAVIEFARHVCGLAGANSGEFNPHGPHSVIDLMPDQYGNIPLGGTMRLGSYPCQVVPGTILAEAYGQPLIHERHRHRYEFNNAYREVMQQHGLVVSGTSPDGRIVETVELPGNKHFIGVQFHPEFKSRPNKPHPLFLRFVEKSLERHEQTHPAQ